MKLLTLGGTGPSGLEIIDAALARSHSLVVFVRSPQKLPEKVHAHPDVTVVQGSIHDYDALFAALDGVDAVVSTLGGVPFQKNDLPIKRGYECVIKAMKARGIKRIVLNGTVAISDPENDRRSVKAMLNVGAVHLLVHSMYVDVVACGKLFMSEAAEGLDWTILRVPVLNNGPRTEVIAGYVGDGKVGWSLSRSDIGWFFVNEVESGQWIRKLPMISSGSPLRSD
ncbi:hypothetical protein BOTBODRAFT_453510 [Botryobasidium botryosum FD-172 SS1]|uniref:NAD(P)-binding domain-containing protein n=1 Tax=Botryobasidium botryosum (strain FD-172 SS1) TaxID=930990 RepID=A0A067MJ46_BOTB1|nr:hypothetical protein BOTBODRAFT_453510 [Botryobasidium botryosum FD-172 SS1]